MTQSTNQAPGPLSRRRLMQLAGASALGFLTGATHLRPAPLHDGNSIVAEGPWGHIEKLGEGVWGVLSTPLAHDDWSTLCNGGIVAGSDRVLVIESFARPVGAGLVAQHARELTGRWPTDVLLTHYHGDHSGGLEGFTTGDLKPVVWMTETTRRLVKEADGQRNESPDTLRQEMLDTSRLIDPEEVLQLDLGGCNLTIHPRHGHTLSDVTVELDEPSIVFCGDLVWNQMFPNFRDTLPSALSRSVRSLRRETATTYVPGHGPLATENDVARFRELIDAVEDAAREATEKGIPLAEAAAGFLLPSALDDWHLFQQSYFEVALGAWYKEWDIDPAG